jgi:glycosyltransferase involved in cell wall biosynthesis
VLQFLGHFADGLEGLATFHQVPPMSRPSLFHPVKLINLLRTIAPDVVHSHTGVWFKASRAARVAGVPVVVHTEHGRPDPVPFTDRLIDNRASRRTDVIIAVSDALAAVLRRQVVHDTSRIRVIPNGVDVGGLPPAGERHLLRQELGIPPDAMVIGSIGRLETVKNYQLALKALALLDADGGPLPLLVLAGDGSERATLETLASELGVASRVMFLGWRADAERLYGAFDLFTLASRSEGTSISLLEAMSAGVCPIVTDVGGNSAVLGPELASLLVPDDDAGALAAAWKRHLADRALREALGAKARIRAERAFSVEQMVERHVALYRELVERTREGASLEPGAKE